MYSNDNVRIKARVKKYLNAVQTQYTRGAFAGSKKVRFTIGIGIHMVSFNAKRKAASRDYFVRPSICPSGISMSSLITCSELFF